MEDVELPVQPPLWKQYVDDTFTALPQEQIQLFHDNLNLIEPTIQFTIGTEVEGTLPFLDIRVTHHADGSLATSVFRKKTHTDRYLDFDSHPLAHKIAVARMLLTRADRSVCRCLTGMLRRSTSLRPSTAMGTPQGWLRRSATHLPVSMQLTCLSELKM